MKNYYEVIKDKDEVEYIYDNNLFKDKRENFYSNDKYQKFYWLNYYSALCTMPRNSFDVIHGFDENFEFWGAEDIDIGYRLSRVCLIKYSKLIRGVHISHERDQIKNEYCNRLNIIYMLKKYSKWYFEVLLTFRTNLKIMYECSKIVNQLRQIKMQYIPIDDKKNSVYINTISLDFPNGNIIEFDENSKRKENHLIGLYTAKENEQYDNAYITEDIFTYPQFFACRILQEAIRISKKTWIVYSENSVRVDWYSMLEIKEIMGRTAFLLNSNSISEYSFRKVGTMLQVESKYAQITNLDIKIYKDYAKKDLQLINDSVNRIESWSLINICSLPNTQYLERFLSNYLNINYANKYYFTVFSKEFLIKDCIPQRVLAQKSNILILCDDVFMIEHSFLKTIRNTENDIIADCNGNISFFNA